MKGYKDYMDTISVSPKLHEKIMQKVNRQPIPVYRNRTVLRYTGMAACFAVLLLCVLTLPNLISENEPTIPGMPSHPQYALTLNTIDSQTAVSSIFIDGHFWHELTNEQSKALLPDLGFPISGTAYYSGDGTLYDVAAFEVTPSGNVAMKEEIYTKTTIRFAPGEIVSCAIYSYEPIESNVYGVPVVVGAMDVGILNDDGIILYVATFKIGDVAYSVELYDSKTGESGLSRLTEIVNAIIRNGAANLSILENPVIPELRDEQLSLAEACADPDFGAFLPTSVPSAFSFDSARRSKNQENDSLMALWGTGELGYIRWFVSKPTEHDTAHIVSIDEHEKYDVSLYPIPWALSVPDEFHYYFQSPVFLAEEISIDVIQARTRWEAFGRAGSTPNWQTSQFSVLYDDVLITVSMNGVSPEQIWEMILDIEKR